MRVNPNYRFSCKLSWTAACTLQILTRTSRQWKGLTRVLDAAEASAELGLVVIVKATAGGVVESEVGRSEIKESNDRGQGRYG